MGGAVSVLEMFTMYTIVRRAMLLMYPIVLLIVFVCLVNCCHIHCLCLQIRLADSITFLHKISLFRPHGGIGMFLQKIRINLVMEVVAI